MRPGGAPSADRRERVTKRHVADWLHSAAAAATSNEAVIALQLVQQLKQVQCRLKASFQNGLSTVCLEFALNLPPYRHSRG